MSPSSPDSRLLDDDEPSPVLVERLDGDSPIFLVCDHAGARIPRKLKELGLSEVERFRHIAWDIGALGVAQAISAEMDAALISQGLLAARHRLQPAARERSVDRDPE